jgi:hypothetical protein
VVDQVTAPVDQVVDQVTAPVEQVVDQQAAAVVPQVEQTVDDVATTVVDTIPVPEALTDDGGAPSRSAQGEASSEPTPAVVTVSARVAAAPTPEVSQPAAPDSETPANSNADAAVAPISAASPQIGPAEERIYAPEPLPPAVVVSDRVDRMSVLPPAETTVRDNVPLVMAPAPLDKATASDVVTPPSPSARDTGMFENGSVIHSVPLGHFDPLFAPAIEPIASPLAPLAPGVPVPSVTASATALSITTTGPPGGATHLMSGLVLAAIWRAMWQVARLRPAGIRLPDLAPPG